ncbi:hypothetical protein CA51_51890 [Rosistilla oblonga]|nr:hypothetical protein [Rosistilla oblonga]QDV15276.1 hypothetical protein CA51_51890 [Rosistilla oblonga]
MPKTLRALGVDDGASARTTDIDTPIATLRLPSPHDKTLNAISTLAT